MRRALAWLLLAAALAAGGCLNCPRCPPRLDPAHAEPAPAGEPSR